MIQIAFALTAVLWWISLWGLSDLLTESWSRTSRIQYYTSILILTTAAALWYPQLIERF